MPLQHLENAPLVETIFELRFPGEPRVLTSLDAYYEEVREAFPQVFVPNAQPGLAPALQPWEFKSQTGLRWIAISVNAFAFHVRDYVDYKDFKNQVLRLADSFCRQYRITGLTRVGTRYLNQILILRPPDKPIPLSNYLNMGFCVPEVIDASALEDIHLQLATRRAGTQLVLGLHYVAQPESLILDLDCGVVDEVSSSSLASHLDTVHGCVEDAFAGLAADQYMEYMKGDTL